MKTIAISIDEGTLDALDKMSPAGRAAGQGRTRRKRTNRSELIRRALSDFLERQQRMESEEADRRAIARHREVLGRQVAALVEEQAKP